MTKSVREQVESAKRFVCETLQGVSEALRLGQDVQDAAFELRGAKQDAGDVLLMHAELFASAEENAAEVARLRGEIQKADDALIELNLGNYNDDDVRQEQNGMLEASAILRAALSPQPVQGGGE